MAGTSEQRQSAREGDAVLSFDAWYAGEHARLSATLLLATGDVDLASEGADEAFARALERWDQVSIMDSPTGWAYKVALNHIRRTARRQTVERLLLLKKAPLDHVPAPAGEVWALVSGLPQRQREVVVLRHIGDLREGEIAHALGISRSTVSSTLADAHHRLGDLLNDPDPDEENEDV